MTVVDPSKGHVDVDILQRFASLMQSGRLAHAYLISGPKGIGKAATALALARLFVCSKDGRVDCDCPACQKVLDGNHPDVFVVEKPVDKNSILIGQLIHRANNEYDPVLPKFIMRPLEAQRRVLIVRDAHVMTEEAANCFLKTLEEPPKATVMLLTSSLPSDLLPTIISRCHEVRLFPEAYSALASRLVSEYDVGSFEAGILARFSSGSAGRALEIKEDLMGRKNVILDEFILGIAREDIIKKYSASRDTAREVCGLVQVFFRDVLLFKSGVSESELYNRDRLVDVRRGAERYSREDIERIMAQLVKVRAGVDANHNVKIALTVLKEMF